MGLSIGHVGIQGDDLLAKKRTASESVERKEVIDLGPVIPLAIADEVSQPISRPREGCGREIFSFWRLSGEELRAACLPLAEAEMEAGRRGFLKGKTGGRGFRGEGATGGGVGAQPGIGAEEKDSSQEKAASVSVVSSSEGVLVGSFAHLDLRIFQRVHRRHMSDGE